MNSLNFILFCLSATTIDAFHAGTKPSFIPNKVAKNIALQSTNEAHVEKEEHSSFDEINGPILTPSSPSDDDATQFDIGCVANPVVIPPSNTNQKWQMYYYGNAGSWNHNQNCFLPTGWCGLAESHDGIQWTKVAGPLEGGAILSPASSNGAWDAIHIGVGDVVRVETTTKEQQQHTSELHMYYFGASGEEVAMGSSSGSSSSIIGMKMRIGRAISLDEGRTWEKSGVVLDIDEHEGFFASWPRLIVPQQGNDDCKEPWRMLYHSFNGKKWRVFGAESFDCGDTWTKTGLVLEGGDEEANSFDSAGIGTRAVAPWRDGLLMVYEGVNSTSLRHCLGAAYCEDVHGGGEWTKLESAEPIMEPGKDPLGDWTCQVIGTPWLVAMEDGSLRLYHCAKSGPDAKMSIGVLISDSGGISSTSWRKPTLQDTIQM